jgi:hypothetical protein
MSNRLFPKGTVDLYGHLLQKVLAVIPKNINLGSLRSQLGTHSNRKGALTFLVSLAVCLSPINIFLRAGWSLGNVKDRYIFSGTAGDNIVGRCNAGNDVSSRDFLILPPHFLPEAMPILHEIGMENILEGYEDYPKVFQVVILHLFANIIYHVSWLRENFDSIHHPLFQQRIFTQPVTVGGQMYRCIVDVFAKSNLVVTGHGKCVRTGMVATGVPPHLVLVSEVGELTERITKLENRLSREASERHAMLLNQVDELPERLRVMLLEHFQINGASPVNMKDIETLIDNKNSGLLEKMKVMVDELRALYGRNCDLTNEAMTPGNNDVTSAPSTMSEKFEFFKWPGCEAYHMVPFGFEFPSCNVKSLWDLWFFGNGSARIRPYRNLSEKFSKDLVRRLDKERCSRAKKLVGMIVSEMKAKNYLPEGTSDVKHCTLTQSDTAFAKAYPTIYERIKGQTARNNAENEIAFMTLVGFVYNKKKRGVAESSDPQNETNVEEQAVMAVANPVGKKAKALISGPELVCNFDICEKKATFGFVGGQMKFCAKHKCEGMISKKTKAMGSK